jgi:hypothetical protein
MSEPLGKEVHRVVKVDDIAEFPTALGSRCLLLRKLGMDAYQNTEEELLCALTQSTLDPSSMQTCMLSSRCKAFWDVFQKGITPYMERDPIRLIEYRGQYWVCEGKHRVCLAKRAGIEEIKAYVYPMAKDSYSLLPTVGTPCAAPITHHFHAEIAESSIHSTSGDAAVLWLGNGSGMSRFTLSPAVLDETHTTGGHSVELSPGLSYSISYSRSRSGVFGHRRVTRVDSTVTIEENHRNMRIWLLAYPAGKVMSRSFRRNNATVSIEEGRTIYRTGCWRNHHLTNLVSALY